MNEIKDRKTAIKWNFHSNVGAINRMMWENLSETGKKPRVSGLCARRRARRREQDAA